VDGYMCITKDGAGGLEPIEMAHGETWRLAKVCDMFFRECRVVRDPHSPPPHPSHCNPIWPQWGRWWQLQRPRPCVQKTP
jgi:hypothetical protein